MFHSVLKGWGWSPDVVDRHDVDSVRDSVGEIAGIEYEPGVELVAEGIA